MPPINSPRSPTSPLVWITGASSGIGWALARQYHQQGWRLALLARRADQLRTQCSAAGIDASPGGVHAIYAADVCVPASLQQAAQDCLATQGLPDVVIANAGISRGVDTAHAEDLPVMAEVYATNVLGLAATFQPFITAMQSRGHGTLVGVTSVAGIRGLPGHAAYCGSKAAAIAHCESLRGELRGSGVKVVTLAPGYVTTPLTADNPYPMPFLMSAEAFAAKAIKTIAQAPAWRVIPWPMACVSHLLRWLPRCCLDRILARHARKPRYAQKKR